MQTVLVFVSAIWLVVGFAAWLTLGVLAFRAMRHRNDATGSPEIRTSSWRPSLHSVSGLAAFALYASLLATLLGVGAMIGWELVGDDRLGLFTPMILLADVLAIALVAAYWRVVILLRRESVSRLGLLWPALAVTVTGQAISLGVLCLLYLEHTGAVPFLI